MASTRSFSADPDISSDLLRQLGLAEEEVVRGPSPKLSDYRKGKRLMHLAGKKGSLLHPCASLDPRYVCCGVHVMGLVSNCPFECSYCFLQNYLTDTTFTLIAETDAIMAEVEGLTSSASWRLFRIGTWELGDSLANETVARAAAMLVERFAGLDNAILKLRTKGDCVAPLLRVHPRGRCVVSWTMNPQPVVARQEIGTASVSQRIGAMARVIDAGYMVGLHFDPLLLFPGWEDAYYELVMQIFSVVDPGRVCWISLGSLRFNPEMKRKIEINYPKSGITAQEMVSGDDNKLRYPRPVRMEQYRWLLRSLKEAGADECFVYLCMERPVVWKGLFDDPPQSIGELDYRFAKHLRRRFPSHGYPEPERRLYIEAAEEMLSNRHGPFRS